MLLDPNSFAPIPNGVIVLQYNPDTLTRSFKIKSVEEGGDRSEALRLTGPPVETIKLDAELDATDQLEQNNPTAVNYGIAPQIAALEILIYPASSALQNNFNLAQQGTLEIIPMISPLPVFVWSVNRIAPVRITDLSVTEEAFDPKLNPIRAKVSLGLRVLTVDDLGFDQKGSLLYMVYQRTKEQLASIGTGALSSLGIGGIP
ncbi:MAG: hypothetical protein ACLPXB_01305 [Thiobacillaceae bacterium]